MIIGSGGLIARSTVWQPPTVSRFKSGPSSGSGMSSPSDGAAGARASSPGGRSQCSVEVAVWNVGMPGENTFKPRNNETKYNKTIDDVIANICKLMQNSHIVVLNEVHPAHFDVIKERMLKVDKGLCFLGLETHGDAIAWQSARLFLPRHSVARCRVPRMTCQNPQPSTTKKSPSPPPPTSPSPPPPSPPVPRVATYTVHKKYPLQLTWHRREGGRRVRGGGGGGDGFFLGGRRR